jgi:hypothetical protein
MVLFKKSFAKTISKRNPATRYYRLPVIPAARKMMTQLLFFVGEKKKKKMSKISMQQNCKERIKCC